MGVFLGGSKNFIVALFIVFKMYIVSDCRDHWLLCLLGCGGVVCMYCGLESVCVFW